MKRGVKYFSRDKVIAIYLATGLRKNIAADHGVSLAAVCCIKNGTRHARITDRWRIAAPLNAALISLACTGEP